MSVLVEINMRDQSFNASGLQLVADQVTIHREGDRWGGMAPRIELDVSPQQIAQFVERFQPKPVISPAKRVRFVGTLDDVIAKTEERKHQLAASGSKRYAKELEGEIVALDELRLFLKDLGR